MRSDSELMCYDSCDCRSVCSDSCDRSKFWYDNPVHDSVDNIVTSLKSNEDNSWENPSTISFRHYYYLHNTLWQPPLNHALSENGTDAILKYSTTGTGNGLINYPDGSVYLGDYANGLFHGKGIFMYSPNDSLDRVIYDGYWEAGKKEGQGRMRWKDGSEYVGGFKDNGRHGFGKRVYLANDQLNSCERHWSCGVCDESLRVLTLELSLTNEVRPNGYYVEEQWTVRKGHLW